MARKKSFLRSISQAAREFGCVPGACLMKVNPARKLLKYFRVFYAAIADNPKIHHQTVFEQYALERRHSKCVNVAIRHDVDLALDLVLPLAEYERMLSIRASYYFLTKTAPYDLWNSNVPRRIAQMGHEVGLHSDHAYEAKALHADGLARIREDVKRLSDLAGVPVKGMVWHGGKHAKALGIHNYDLYEKVPAQDLGLVYHDAALYHPRTRKWKCAHLLSDSENNLRFVPGKIKCVWRLYNGGS